MREVELVPCPQKHTTVNTRKYLKCRVCHGSTGPWLVSAALSVEYALLDIDGLHYRSPNEWCDAVDALRKRHGLPHWELRNANER